MCDNNLNSDNDSIDLFEKRKATCILLRNLAVDYEQQLYNVNKQLKQQENLLKEKEQELGEIERTKVHNLDLFSPIYSKAYDTSQLVSDIDNIKTQINNLNQNQEELTKKVLGLKNAAEYIDDIKDDNKDNESEKDIEAKHILTDKGLGILEAQEIERQRIARDLHDTTVQNLTSLVHKSELCVKLIDIDTIRAKLELNSMSSTLKMVINDMRGIIYNLKPMTLDDLGLTITIQRYANKLMNLNNMQVRVTSNEETKEILSVIKLTVFRIVQEACNNVIKHANASLISIDINYENHNVTVKIQDNGKGFNSDNKEKEGNSSEQTSSFGLSIMKERISLLSGTLDIKSEKGKGTIVTVSVPLTTCEEKNNEQTD